jgi:hypothetical protein
MGQKTNESGQLKFPGIAAPAAQVFRGFALAETFYNGFCPGRSQNIRQFFPEYISKIDNSVAV